MKRVGQGSRVFISTLSATPRTNMSVKVQECIYKLITYFPEPRKSKSLAKLVFHFRVIVLRSENLRSKIKHEGDELKTLVAIDESGKFYDRLGE
jgi:hypothetical protein